jgi:hypothetical protein
MSSDFKYHAIRHVMPIDMAIEHFGEAAILPLLKEAWDTAHGRRTPPLACFQCRRDFSMALPPAGIVLNEIVRGGGGIEEGLQNVAYGLCETCTSKPDLVRRKLEAQATRIDPGCVIRPIRHPAPLARQ